MNTLSHALTQHIFVRPGRRASCTLLSEKYRVRETYAIPSLQQGSRSTSGVDSVKILAARNCINCQQTTENVRN